MRDCRALAVVVYSHIDALWRRSPSFAARCDTRVLQHLFRLASVLGIWIRINERLKGYVRNSKAALLHGRRCALEQQFVMLRGTNLGVRPLDTRRHQHARQRGHQRDSVPPSMHSLPQTACLTNCRQAAPSSLDNMMSSLTHSQSFRAGGFSVGETRRGC